MSVHILISGALFKNPELKTSKTGKTYATASIRTASADNNAADFWNLLVFGDTAQAELMRLGEGDKLSAQGSVKLEIYNGKISRTVFVDHVLALRAPPKERKPKAPPAGSKAGDEIAKRSILPDATPETAAGGPAFFNDDVPFEAAL
ncbi:single-stranded DNA-binding protein [Bradyrhizobium sp. Ash2021]|uniref:single-stranded DNA-binding protein n=1 Tax=Bradyrhizobium sp. Ash2021 TaxID=2954771 RepID=UPI0028164160|nr:single-stranded DNA-binding protein [Bradyrhizobium sp. Ash2021]WMT77466.1 single-stranded DNA-binding protein [Bradyrhizobium sp. Ash2021]